MKRSLPSAVVTIALLTAFGEVACGSDPAPPATITPGGTSGTGQGATSGTAPVGGAAGVSGSNGVGGAIRVDSSPTGGAGGIRPDSGCATATETGTLVPGNLLFVVDQSGSMKCNLPQDGQSTADCAAFPDKRNQSAPSKWEVTRDALKAAFDALQVNGNAVGLTMFPIEGTDCTPWKRNPEPVADLDVQVLDGVQNAALDTFLDGVVPGGQTPIAGSTILGYRYLQSRIVSSALPGSYFLVLMTDGAETCETGALPGLYQNPDGHIYNAGLLGIRTFVIGAPGSEEARGLLSEIAYLGGTPRSPTCTHNPTGNVGDCHFDMTTSTDFAADLTAALLAINSTVLSCEFDVPAGANADRSRVNVEIDGQLIVKDDRSACDTANGWQYKAGDNTKIELCGSACSTAKTPGASLKIVLGCITIPA